MVSLISSIIYVFSHLQSISEFGGLFRATEVADVAAAAAVIWCVVAVTDLIKR